MDEVNLSRRRALVAIAAGASFPLLAGAQQNAGPYVPTPWKIVDDMLRLAAVRKDDFADRVKFEKRDLFETNIGEASVLTLYLLPHTVTQLVPRIFAEMRAGSRVVSHDYPLGPWQPERHLQFDVQEKIEISGTTRTVLYLYIVPARVGGSWSLELPPTVTKQPARLAFEQDPARTRGSATVGNRKIALDAVKITGESVRFEIPGLAAGGKPLALQGVVSGNVIEGTATAPGGPAPWRATRL